MKKEVVMKDFRMQIRGKSKTLVKSFDKPFFDTINRIFRKKPEKVIFHITKENTLTFNITFNDSVKVYLEHFPNTHPSTLMTISSIDDEMMESNDLDTCLDIIDDLVTTI